MTKQETIFELARRTLELAKDKYEEATYTSDVLKHSVYQKSIADEFKWQIEDAIQRFVENVNEYTRSFDTSSEKHVNEWVNTDTEGRRFEDEIHAFETERFKLKEAITDLKSQIDFWKQVGPEFIYANYDAESTKDVIKNALDDYNRDREHPIPGFTPTAIADIHSRMAEAELEKLEAQLVKVNEQFDRLFDSGSPEYLPSAKEKKEPDVYMPLTPEKLAEERKRVGAEQSIKLKPDSM